MNLSRDDFYYLVYRVRYHEILELALQKYPVLRNTTEATAHTEFERNIVKFLGGTSVFSFCSCRIRSTQVVGRRWFTRGT